MIRSLHISLTLLFGLTVAAGQASAHSGADILHFATQSDHIGVIILALFGIICLAARRYIPFE